ncbi:hypothetical protein OH77DRAFT_1519936 [Trametes cingulata]|nr:hypothetical protein OH77DRAFT_1519936 [Trametes cingulata]
MTKEIQLAVLAGLDFPALMAFRRVSKDCKTLVMLVLETEFKRLLSGIAKNMELFRCALEEYEAVIGGYAALAFFTRIELPADHAIQLFLPAWAFTPMLFHMQIVQEATLVRETDIGLIERGLVSSARLRTASRDVVLFQSSKSSAMVPILHGPNTTLMCYISATHFGVPWPRLTFTGRGLIGDFPAGGAISAALLKTRGFDFKLYPWMWEDGGIPQEWEPAWGFINTFQIQPIV